MNNYFKKYIYYFLFIDVIIIFWIVLYFISIKENPENIVENDNQIIDKSQETIKKYEEWKIYFNSWIYYPTIYHLDYSWKWITKIDDICKIIDDDIKQKILSIDFSDNNIESFDIDLSCLWNLKEFEIPYNKLKNLWNISSLTWLEILELQKNQINDLNWIQNLTNLKTLNLWYNNISDISLLKNLIQLTTLEIQHNKLIDLKEIYELKNLSILKLEFNNISQIEENILDIFPNLKLFTILWNKIENQILINKINELNQKYVQSF